MQEGLIQYNAPITDGFRPVLRARSTVDSRSLDLAYPVWVYQVLPKVARTVTM
jgi:hypothetical protein